MSKLNIYNCWCFKKNVYVKCANICVIFYYHSWPTELKLYCIFRGWDVGWLSWQSDRELQIIILSRGRRGLASVRDPDMYLSNNWLSGMENREDNILGEGIDWRRWHTKNFLTHWDSMKTRLKMSLDFSKQFVYQGNQQSSIFGNFKDKPA